MAHIGGVGLTSRQKPEVSALDQRGRAGSATLGKYWIAGATEHPGTWWPHWFEWVREKDPREIPARKPGGGKVKPICDAPGTYVLMKS